MTPWPLLALLTVHPASPMQKLASAMDAACSGFHGRIGYYVKNLKTGETIGLHAEDRFPSASTIKTAIMIEAVNQVVSGKLKWTDKI